MTRLLAMRELRNLLALPSTWFIVAILQFIFTWFFLNNLQSFLDIQPQLAQLANAPGVTTIIGVPLFNMVALLLMMLIPIFTMRLIAEERRNQTLPLLLSSPLSVRQIVLGKFFGLTIFLLLMVSSIPVMIYTLAVGTHLDHGLLLSNMLGLSLLIASYVALGLYISTLTAQPIVAAIGALAVLVGLWLADIAATAENSPWHLISPWHHFQSFSTGLLDSGDTLFFLLFIGLFLLLALYKLLQATASRNAAFALLLVALASGLNYFTNQHPLQRDVTQNAINSLEPGSIEVLKQLTGPVNITVYATEQDPRLGDIRKIIRDFMSLYQRYKTDMNLTFIDPEKEPDKARAAHVQLNGEMVVEYAGRSEHLTQINEQIVTSTLLRLAHTNNQTVMYLDGHGERKLDGIANHDLGTLFGAKLKQNGFHLGSLNLALAQEVPDNCNVLVITQPQLDIMPGEIDKLQRYIEHGGNVLWLIDAEPLHGLEPLAETLGLLLPPGIVIDPTASEMRAPPTWSIGASYLPHPITRNFNLITAYPSARPLMWEEGTEWQRHPLVEVATRGWVSRTPPTDKAKFDKAHDTPGPVTIATALQRTLHEKEQRIVIVGNGAFLANSFAGNGGNVDLGVNMVNWLASEDHLINLEPHTAKDSKLTLSKMQLNVISIGFLLGLPLILFGTGIYLWWKRRRA